MTDGIPWFLLTNTSTSSLLKPETFKWTSMVQAIHLNNITNYKDIIKYQCLKICWFVNLLRRLFCKVFLCYTMTLICFWHTNNSLLTQSKSENSPYLLNIFLLSITWKIGGVYVHVFLYYTMPLVWLGCTLHRYLNRFLAENPHTLDSIWPSTYLPWFVPLWPPVWHCCSGGTGTLVCGGRSSPDPALPTVASTAGQNGGSSNQRTRSSQR